MKTKNWIILILALLVICVAASVILLNNTKTAGQAEVYVDGVLVMTLDLRRNQTVTVEAVGGTNTITVQDGRLSVTQADCPDGYCMERGWCDGGTDIICLPHRLVIRFVGSGLDQVAG